MSARPPLLEGDRVGDAALLPVLGVGQAGALGVGAFATRDAFEALHAGQGPAAATLAALVLAGLAAAALDLVARRRAEALGQSYARALRRGLYAHIAGLPRRRLSERRVGALSLRFVGDLSAARGWFGRGLPRLVSAAVVLPGAAVVLMLLAPPLTALAAIPVALSLALMLALALGLEARHRPLRARRASLSIAAMERIAVSPELDLLGRTPRELDALDEDGAALRRHAVARIGRVGLLRLVPQAGAAAAGALMLAGAARFGVTPGATAAGLSVLAILMIPLREMADAWDQRCAWRVARGKIDALLDDPSRRRRVVPRGRPVALRLDALPVAGRRVSASLPAGAGALVTGPAGSGKSQLAALVAGLDPAPPGRLLYDGAEGALPRVAHVGDAAVVLQGSLRRALTLGLSPRPASGRIAAAARRFGLDGLVARLGGLRGRIGEGARNASEAERLRIALVRAALARPDLVVIDSAAFVVDPQRAALLGSLRAACDATLLVMGPPMPDLGLGRVIDLAAFPLVTREAPREETRS